MQVRQFREIATEYKKRSYNCAVLNLGDMCTKLLHYHFLLNCVTILHEKLQAMSQK